MEEVSPLWYITEALTGSPDGGVNRYEEYEL